MGTTIVAMLQMFNIMVVHISNIDFLTYFL